MRADELVSSLERIGLPKRAAARFLHVDERTVRRWASGDLAVPVPVAMLLALMIETGSTPERVTSLLP